MAPSHSRCIPPADDDAPQSQVLAGVKIYSQEAGYTVAVVGRYMVLVVKDRTTASTVSLIRRALTELNESYETFGYLCVLEPTVQLLIPPDIREGLNSTIKRFSTRFTGAAIVFEKTGFQATAVRSFVTAVNFASRATHPNHVFANLREGISWLARLTPGEPTSSRLFQIATQLRNATRASDKAFLMPSR
jgi:hypothetical protein